MIRQWNGVGGKCDFSPVMKPNCCRFLGSNPGSGGGEGGETGYRVKKGEVGVQKKKREGLASKVGVKKKQPFLERRAYFFLKEQVSSKKIGFLSWNFFLPHHFLMPKDAAKSIFLQHNKKYHFPSSTFAFWEMLGSTKQASQDGGMSTLKSTEGPSAVCMSINVPHDRQDRHDHRQTSYSCSLFVAWLPSPSAPTASKSYRNISTASINSICTEDAQRGTCEDRNHWNHWASCNIW